MPSAWDERLIYRNSLPFDSLIAPEGHAAPRIGANSSRRKLEGGGCAAKSLYPGLLLQICHGGDMALLEACQLVCRTCKLGDTDRFALMCALLPAGLLSFKRVEDPCGSATDVLSMYSRLVPRNTPFRSMIDGLGGEMTTARRSLAAAEFGRVLRALVGMREVVCDGRAPLSEISLIIKHCEVLIEYLESVVSDEMSRTFGDLEDEHDIFSAVDVSKNMLYIYRQAAKLAGRYLVSIHKAAMLRRMGRVQSKIRSHMWHCMDAMTTVFDGDVGEASANFEHFCIDFGKKMLLFGYLEPHEILHWERASAMAGKESMVLHTGDGQPEAIASHQAYLLCRGLVMTVATKDRRIVVQFPPHKLSAGNVVFSDFQDLCKSRILPRSTLESFYKDVVRETPQVTVTRLDNTYAGHSVVTTVGARVDIRPYCIVCGRLVPLCVILIEPVAGMYEIKTGFLMYQGGKSVLHPSLCRLPARELMLL